MEQQTDVKCPWCNAKMSAFLTDDTWDCINPKVQYSGHVECDACGAEGPYTGEFPTREEAERAAIAAAKKRWVEPNRVLTKEEVETHCNKENAEPLWTEREGCWNGWRIAKDFPLKTEYFSVYDLMQFSDDLYGKTWRCWIRKPTDEERAAAPWEEEK